MAVFVPAGEDSHIPTEPDAYRHDPSRLTKGGDKNDFFIAEAGIDAGKYLPPHAKPFMADLDLKLIGTMVADSPEKTIAVVGYSVSHVQETLAEGDHAENLRVKNSFMTGSSSMTARASFKLC